MIPFWQYIQVSIRNPHWVTYELNGDSVREWYAGMSRSEGPKIYDYDEIKKLESGYRALPEPLSISRIWKKAIEAGAPTENVVANIHFWKGSYLFEIDGTDFKYTFDGDGRLVK